MVSAKMVLDLMLVSVTKDMRAETVMRRLIIVKVVRADKETVLAF